MKVLQVGLAKSGNSWVYRILEELYREAGLERTSYIETDPVHEVAQDWELSFDGQADIDVLDIEDEGLFYRISSIYRRKIKDTAGYFGKANHVWTHSAWCDKTENVLKYFDGYIYIVRDPRDRLLSLADFLLGDYMKTQYPHSYNSFSAIVDNHLEGATESWVEHIVRYLNSPIAPEIFFLRYETLSENTRSTIQSIAEYLSLNPDNIDVEGIVERTSFSSLQKENSDHFKKARMGSWRDQLTKKQQRRVSWIASPLLEALGYPTSADDEIEERAGALSIPDQAQLKRATKRLHRYRLLHGLRAGLRLGIRQFLKAL